MCAIGLSQGNVHEAVKLTSQLMTKVMLPTLKSVMEKEKKVKHKAVCDRIETALDDLEKYRIKVADGSECQFLVNPMMQSGGKYTTDVLHPKPYVLCVFVDVNRQAGAIKQKQHQNKQYLVSVDVVPFTVVVFPWL